MANRANGNREVNLKFCIISSNVVVTICKMFQHYILIECKVPLDSSFVLVHSLFSIVIVMWESPAATKWVCVLLG